MTVLSPSGWNGNRDQMSEFLDYYSVLGLDMDCTQDQIKIAFRKKLLEVR